jgi:hypothetical protein
MRVATTMIFALAFSERRIGSIVANGQIPSGVQKMESIAEKSYWVFGELRASAFIVNSIQF